ncbi:YybS family protein [Bacillus sp. 31A1R]|uniref:YybS family protein n=1 Tax=Robertmurraya mangrovi TaxID=3098077 RepID=A0ABU5IX06_9BACI|nr:YybS family protein [Bacillus sp. 31A1R]MDZ5471666.1 YybS family protein [Bacillus sp. 31A1R]
MRSTNRLTEGALFLAIFAVLLLVTLYVPVLGLVINLFLALPFMMFSAKNDRKSSGIFLVGAVFISLIVGTLLSIPLTLAYGLTGIVIGDFIREKKNRVASFIAGSLAFLVNLVVQYAIAVAFFKIDFIKESIQVFKESIEMSVKMLGAVGQSPNEQLIEQFEAGVEMIGYLTPSLFVMASFLIVFLIQLVSFPIIKRFGIPVVGWRPFRELQLPKSLLWYYLFSLLASVIFKVDEGSYWFLAIINIAFVLQLFMILQGLSFIYYFSYQKGLAKAIPVIITVLVLFIPFLLYIVRILGIIDLGFDLRKRMELKK